MKTLITFLSGLLVSVIALSNFPVPVQTQSAITSCSVSTRPNPTLGRFLSNLFTTDYWPARWECGNWSDVEGWTYIISDLIIFFAYFSIPLLLMWYSRSIKLKGKVKAIFVLFGAFIFLCGSTHLVDVIIFWEPVYRVSLITKFFTALVSLSTTIVLGIVIPLALKYKSPEQVEEEISQEVRLRNKLKQANKELEAFTYSVSHDLRAPLRAIIGYIDVIQERTQAIDLPQDTDDLIARIQYNGSKMNLLIDELLKYSRVDKILLNYSEINTNESIKRIVDSYFPNQKNKITIQKNLPNIMGDPQLIETVFMNLISNAIKYSANSENPSIEITSIETNKAIILSVKDNGIGLDMRHKDRIFQVFERLHQETDYEGSGVGLAICKKIMQRHGGEIWVDSVPKSGSTFSLKFQKNENT